MRVWWVSMEFGLLLGRLLGACSKGLSALVFCTERGYRLRWPPCPCVCSRACQGSRGSQSLCWELDDSVMLSVCLSKFVQAAGTGVVMVDTTGCVRSQADFQGRAAAGCVCVRSLLLAPRCLWRPAACSLSCVVCPGAARQARSGRFLQEAQNA